jgi:hypothetical protein
VDRRGWTRRASGNCSGGSEKETERMERVGRFLRGVVDAMMFRALQFASFEAYSAGDVSLAGGYRGVLW